MSGRHRLAPGPALLLAAKAIALLILVVAIAATATRWFPLRNGLDIAHGDLPALASIGVSTTGERPGAVKLVPFERLVGPFQVVPSPEPGAIAGPIALSHRGVPLREVFDLPGFMAARDPVFLDADRIAGDGLLVYLPEVAKLAGSPLRLEYRAMVTPAAIAFLWAAVAVSLLTAIVDRSHESWPLRKRGLLGAGTALGLAGLALAVLNVVGLWVPPRPAQPRIAFPSQEYSVEAAGPWLPPEALERELGSRPGEDPAAYAARANDLLAAHVKHVWNYANASSLGLHVPPWSNFVLWGLGEIQPALYRYHYAAWRPALARSAGMCSQVTLILVGILRDRGLDARIVQLSGHTVVTAEVAPGTWHVLDPDIGVSLPLSLPAIERDPEIVRSRYERRYSRLGHRDPAFAAGVMVGFYGPEGNHVEPRGGHEMLGEAWRVREAIAGLLKWLLPAALIACFVVLAWLASRPAATTARGEGPGPPRPGGRAPT